MSVFSIIRTILLANPVVSAKVSNRVFPIEMPQTEINPTIVFHLSREEDGRHLQGQDQYPVASFIIDSCGANYGVVEALGDDVGNALRDYRGTIGGAEVAYIFTDDLDIFDRGQSGNIWRRRNSFMIRYRMI